MNKKNQYMAHMVDDKLFHIEAETYSYNGESDVYDFYARDSNNDLERVATVSRERIHLIYKEVLVK